MVRRTRTSDVSNRLPWLLVFRAAVASILLVLTLAADASASPLRLISSLLYGVVIGTYLVVFVLGMLLRTNASPIIIAAVHLATAEMAAFIVVGGTGGVESMLSFLYLLVILDGAIIGGRQVAIGMASASSVAYGLQLVAQLYGAWDVGTFESPEPSAYATAAVVHVAAFYLVGLLSGYLADLVQRARDVASIAQVDLERVELVQDAVLESLPAGVLTYDALGRVLTANAAAARILGGAVPEMVGKLVPAELGPAMRADGGATEVALEVGGSARHLLVSRSTVELDADDGGGPVQVLVIDDRTELRALEVDLAEKKRLASLGELAAAIAHEIRNPLAAISGAVELLLSEPTDGNTRGRLQAIVLREIDRLNQLVGDFLVYARPSPPRRRAIDVVAIVHEVCEVLRRDATWSNYTVRVTAPESLDAEVDPRQIRQVLWNLVRNGLEASGESASVELNIFDADGDLVVEVTDMGEGIPAEHLEHVFEPFRTTKRAGTGLGLPVVHRIVEAHGGRVDVASTVGSGTTVRFVIPNVIGKARLAIVADGR